MGLCLVIFRRESSSVAWRSRQYLYTCGPCTSKAPPACSGLSSSIPTLCHLPLGQQTPSKTTKRPRRLFQMVSFEAVACHATDGVSGLASRTSQSGPWFGLLGFLVADDARPEPRRPCSGSARERRQQTWCTWLGARAYAGCVGECVYAGVILCVTCHG